MFVKESAGQKKHSNYNVDALILKNSHTTLFSATVCFKTPFMHICYEVYIVLGKKRETTVMCVKDTG